MSYFASAVCLIILFDECMLILLVMLQGPHQIINSHAVGSVSQDLALFRPVRGDNVDGPVLIPPDIRFLFYGGLYN
ncbi:unknown [Dialister sp. CAG:357]|nr:unknown [Dialister sp. CAG:357]